MPTMKLSRLAVLVSAALATAAIPSPADAAGHVCVNACSYYSFGGEAVMACTGSCSVSSSVWGGVARCATACTVPFSMPGCSEITFSGPGVLIDSDSGAC
jgi:hypothetical protein